ncbi:cell wall anchor protein [Corynebacterium amycolatum]|uniref:cell wall anchor protein n=1 Tax=Corynebacterium amycolatum TaxID=43765 RepID=UPI003EE3FA9C
MSSTQKTQNKKAGAFDIRNVIGALLGLYGLILMLAYLFLDAGVNPETNEAKQPLYNLYAGIALIVVAVIFFVWTKIRPTVVEEADQAE